jgi:Arc/MetJ family transcription regulator
LCIEKNNTMRTNVDLDEKLLTDAMKMSKITVKKDLLNKLLEDYVLYQKRLKILELQGKVKWVGNLDKMRTYDKWEDSR